MLTWKKDIIALNANGQITSTKQKYPGQLCFFLKKDAKTPNPLSAILSENNLPNTVSPWLTRLSSLRKTSS